MIAPANRRIGKYEIARKLGRGGMADVYLAVDSSNGNSVALKLIEHAADSDTRDSIEAERRGADLQARLAAIDPRVVRVYDSGDADGFFYVAMEYVDGQDLSELMSHGPLAVGFACEVASDVARTLDNAHHLEIETEGKTFHGLVHGDIKPKNIRINSRGDVRVLDFGIAKALSLSRRLTRNEFGSVPYASPERLDSGEVSADSDIWSLAVMFYEMVTGLQPYQAASTERLERMIRSRVPPPAAPDPCPEPLRRILVKAMAPNPEVRYASAHDLCADIEAFRAGGTVAAVSEDLDVTRRTRRPGAPEIGETRRTAPAPSDETRPTARPAKEAAALPAAPPRLTPYGYTIGLLSILLIGGLIYGVWTGLSSYLLYQRGSQLAREVESEQLTDLEKIWSRWTELSQGNPSSYLLRAPRKVVKQKFLAAVDHVIDNYRNSDTQVIYEKDWERARAMAARALSVDPDDTIRGKLRLCEGHLKRINGAVHKNAEELNAAVDKFHEAQRFMPNSPDPDLGLARVYIYGIKDIDKGYDTLEQARQHGGTIGNHDRQTLADGYRDRADRLFWDSRNVRGLPPEKDQVKQAAQDYKRALDLYQGIAPWGTSILNLVRVRLSQESANFRLNEIQSEGDSH